jgi:hypothetical protein
MTTTTTTRIDGPIRPGGRDDLILTARPSCFQAAAPAGRGIGFAGRKASAIIPLGW